MCRRAEICVTVAPLGNAEASYRDFLAKHPTGIYADSATVALESVRLVEGKLVQTLIPLGNSLFRMISKWYLMTDSVAYELRVYADAKRVGVQGQAVVSGATYRVRGEQTRTDDTFDGRPVKVLDARYIELVESPR